MITTSIKRLISVFFITLLILSFSINTVRATDIDIMLVYDNGAAAWANSNGGITAFNQDVINRMNQVMQNSGIDATFRLVHSMTVNTTETNLTNALTALQAGSGVYSAVHTARNTYGADLVAMFIDTGSAYGYVGLGYMLSTWAGSPNYAFTTNAIRSVAISHTLTHEIGHNLGAHHSKYQADYPEPNIYLTNPTAPYSAGWYFTGSNGTKYHTIMAYNDDGYGNRYTSAPLFSTPLVTYQGGTTGNAQDGHNSRLIRTTKDIVANYKQGSSTCTYNIIPTTASFQAYSGTSQVNVIASSSRCFWTATSNASWITINSGSSSGTGSGTVYYTVLPNTTTSTRTGTITIAEQTHTVTQEGSSSSCTYSISPTTASFQANSGTWHVDVTASSSSCSWTATSNASWITIISGSSGTGSGTVYYTVTANTSTSTRTGTIIIAEQTHTVTQEGSSSSCTYNIIPTTASFQAYSGTNQVNVIASSSRCFWTATSNASWITINSGSSIGTGSGTVYYTVSANTTPSTRTGTITIAGQTHTVTQDGSTECAVVSISPANAQFAMDGGTGTINVTTSSSSISEENTNNKDELLMTQYFSDTTPIRDKFNQYSSLMQKAETKGNVRIIIKLKERFIPEGLMANEVQVREQRSAIAMAQTSLLELLQRYNIEDVKKFEYIPYMALATDASGLSVIYSNPNVDSVYEDELAKPALSQSVPLIKGDQAWNAGYTGTGWTVAILDTGVQSTHPFFAGKVVSEACYSTTNSTYNSTSVCPNGLNAQIGAGAGVNCSLSIDGCDHGTHVAGIASGIGSSFSGVGKNSNIIAIQVFSRFDNASDCDGNNPCILAYTSDQIKALERVYDLRNTYNISSVNMSLGDLGDVKYTDYCDSSQAPRKAAIDQLRSVGIATVISSGNEGYTDGISAPACISTAVSVGSTTKSDAVSSFSNSASILSLLAPGSSIYSSIPTNTYASWSGTSMAAPHVAGAWALMKHKKPTATVSEILQAFQNTGIAITDSRNGIVKPRINVKSAIDSLCTWTATSNDNWITITSIITGSGSSKVTYAVSPNSGNYRIGTINIGNQTHTVTQSDTVFADVNSSMWSKNYIVAIYNNGITVGCIQSPIRYYCPSTTVTRGQMAAFIIRAKYGENFTYPTTPYFSDAPAGHDFFKYVQRLKYDGITTQTGIYRVNDPVTRGEMAAFIIRAKYGDDNFTWQTTPYFTDVPTGNTFFKYVQRLKQDNITTQTGIYRINDEVSREEMAAFLSRAFLGMQ